MKITITPETEEEKKVYEAKEYTEVYEFALTGTALEKKLMVKPIFHTHGDRYSLLGKLLELVERLRDYGRHDPPER